MIVPFDTPKLAHLPIEQAAMKTTPPPAAVRWQLRYVWKVQGKPEVRQAPLAEEKVYQVDADAGSFVGYQGDAHRDQLYKIGQTYPYVRPELPAINAQQAVYWDLLNGFWGCTTMMVGLGHTQNAQSPAITGRNLRTWPTLKCLCGRRSIQSAAAIHFIGAPITRSSMRSCLRPYGGLKSRARLIRRWVITALAWLKFRNPSRPW